MSDASRCPTCGHERDSCNFCCAKCGHTFSRESTEKLANRLRRIADRQRETIRVFVIFCPLLLLLLLAPDASISRQVTGILAGFYYIVLVIMMACVLSLATASDINLFGALVLVLICLVPIANVILIFMLCVHAGFKLRDARIRVGLFGASKSDVEVAVAVGRCRQCGYDLTGLTSDRCPECGTPISASNSNATSF